MGKNITGLKIAIILAVLIIVSIVIIFIVLPKINDVKDKYQESAIGYFLVNDDTGFLDTTKQEPTKYEVFDNYSDYMDCYNSIDQWASDVIQKYERVVNNYNLSQEMKNQEIDEYKEKVENRVKTIKQEFEKTEYSEKFFKDNNLIVIEHSRYTGVLHSIKIDSINIKNNELEIKIKTNVSGAVGGGQATLFFIHIPKEDMKDVNDINVIVDSVNNSKPGVAYKPIIYLYPTQTTDISVKLLKSENITASYPTYKDGWEVTANPKGDLVDKETGRNLYSLYYEGINEIDFQVEEEGFVVKGEEIVDFLEEKLSILGLTEREAEEMIVYWLPILEANEYNYIRFATNEEINANMPLEINPQPDTIIRVLMIFKKLDNPIDVKEQILQTPTREGYVVVEWGGTELK